MKNRLKGRILPGVLIVIVVALAGWWFWSLQQESGYGDDFAMGNGRIEATEIDVATKQSGRLLEVLVEEADFVTSGQLLARIDVAALEAAHSEAVAKHAQSEHAAATAQVQVALRESELRAAEAQVALRESELDAAQRRLARSEQLVRDGAASHQELDDDRARVSGARAAIAAAQAQVEAAKSAIEAAKTQATGSKAQIEAAQAVIKRIEADLQDAELRAPRDGRVQFIIARTGEVLGAGAPVINMVDVSDVYMTFFLPTSAAGRVAMGAEARILLDAAPGVVIPARINFVSAVAQFTPKTVETASEREKLMFRVRAQIDRELLNKHLELVKTGLPGVAWVKLDPTAEWPQELRVQEQ